MLEVEWEDGCDCTRKVLDTTQAVMVALTVGTVTIMNDEQLAYKLFPMLQLMLADEGKGEVKGPADTSSKDPKTQPPINDGWDIDLK